MPLTHTSYLLDLLAPRLFRQATSRRARVGSRSSSSAAAAVERRSEDEAGLSQEIEGHHGQGRKVEEGPVAGPSRLHGRGQDEPSRLARPPGRSSDNGRYGSRPTRTSWKTIPVLQELPASSGSEMTPTPHLHTQPDYPLPTPSRRLPLYNPNFSPPQPRTPHRQCSLQRRPPSFSSHFALPNPPPASSLLPLLPPDLSKPTGDLLIRYSQRIDDRRTELATRDMMGRMRIAPVSWISDSLSGRREPINTARMPIGRLVQSEQGFGSGDDPPDPGGTGGSLALVPRKPISAEMRERRARSNTWARGMWPPVAPNLCTSPEALDPHTYLCRHHHRLLNPSVRGQQPSFIDAVRDLESLPGTKNRDLLSLLHLHLTYASYSPPSSSTPPTTPLLTPVFQLLLHCPHLQPTRQTLHLLILNTFSAPLSFPLYSTSGPSSSLASRRAKIHSLLTLFQTQWQIVPGCEGWRHIAQHAVRRNDEAWAKEAWEGWWGVRSWDERQDRGGGGKNGEEEEPGGPERGEEGDEDVVFRFRHRGRDLIRWMKVVKSMEDKGWVKQRVASEEDGKPMGKGGCEWISQEERAESSVVPSCNS